MSQTFAQLINGKSATVEFSTGSASTPSVAFSSDTNTGIYSPGADQVAISTNGAGRLFVGNAGDVGIGGAPSGSYKLEVKAGAIDSAAIFDSTNAVGPHVRFSTSGTDRHYLGSAPGFTAGGTSSDFAIRTAGYLALLTGGNNERLRITSAGLVGIGTSSPTGALTVYDGGNQFHIDAPTNANSNIFFRENASTRWVVGYVPGITAFRFSNGSTDVLSLTNSGRVGIGTTSPATALDVQVSGGRLQVYPAVNATGTRILSVNTGNTAAVPIEISGTQIMFTNSNNTPVGQFDTSGRLLVGTSTASSQAVAGSVSATQLILGGDASKRYAGTVGTVTATTGTTVFTFQNTVINTRAAFVKVKIATRSTSNTASNSPCAQYAFQLHKTSLSVCTLNGATTMFEYTYSRATHFAFADSGSGVCTVTLTNPTGQSLTGNYEVEIVDGSAGWALTSVTVT